MDFHLLRLEYVALIIPFSLIVYLLFRVRRQMTRSLIHSSLAQYFVIKSNQMKFELSLTGLVSLILLFIFVALLGPSLVKHEVTVFEKKSGIVFILDLSLSMYAEDIQPSRYEAAKYKIQDALDQLEGNAVGLVAYSGDAHIITPLTTDYDTVLYLLEVMNPALLPIKGSRVDLGLKKAHELFEKSYYTSGHIVLLTDEIATSLQTELSPFIDSKFPVNIIGIGSEIGSPIPILSESGDTSSFLKDHRDQVVIAKLDADFLETMAETLYGNFSVYSWDDKDLTKVLSIDREQDNQVISVNDKRHYWLDQGYYFVFPLLVLLPLLFRKGYFLSLAVGLFLFPSLLKANTFSSFLQNSNQKGWELFQSKDYKASLAQFNDPLWKGISAYRLYEYEEAIDWLNQVKTEDSRYSLAVYNKANALVQLGRYSDAMNAYDEVLKISPDFENAIVNRKLLAKFLEDQEKKSEDTNKQSSTNKDTKKDEKNNQSNESQSSSHQSPKSDNFPSKNERESNSGRDEKNENNADLDSKNQKREEADNSNDSHKDSQLSEKKSEQSLTSEEVLSNASEKKPSTSGKMMEQTNEDREKTLNWLRQLDTSPGELLRRKFIYESYQNGEVKQLDPEDKEKLW